MNAIADSVLAAVLIRVVGQPLDPFLQRGKMNCLTVTWCHVAPPPKPSPFQPS